MGTKISELELVANIGNNDLLEVAIEDAESPSGSSSKSIQYGNIIPQLTSSGCSITKNGTVTPSEGVFTIVITTDELNSGCGIYYEPPINTLLEVHNK